MSDQPPILRDLVVAQQRLDDAVAAVEAARVERDEIIRATQPEVQVRDIVKVTGLGRSRVHQILAGI